MFKKVHFVFLLIPFLGFCQTQIGQDIDGENSNDRSGSSVSISSNGNVIAISAPLNNGSATQSGHVRIYENIGGVWTQIGQDIDGEAEFDRSGNIISLSSNGNIVAIASTENNGSFPLAGHVRVYENIGGIWTQVGQDIDGEALGDRSGTSVSISSDGAIVAIGAPDNDGSVLNIGHVRVFENIGGVWTQIGQEIEGEEAEDDFGLSISLSSNGNILAIGAPLNDGSAPGSGHVRVFENIGGVWTQIGQDIDGEAESDFSGSNLSISSDGTIVAIGATGATGNQSNSGHVRVFENIGGVWTQIGQDINGEAASDFFGGNISISSDGTIVAIGAFGNDGNGSQSGHVRIYKNVNDNWIKVGEDIQGEEATNASGQSTSISSDGTIIAIGAPLNDGNGNFSGHVRVYTIASELAIIEVIDDIAGNSNGINVTADQLNSINGVSGAIEGVNYTTALDNGVFVDENNPTSAEIQFIIDQVNNTLSITDDNISIFNLYPNPAKSEFTIQLQNNIELEKVNIYNNLGQFISSSTNLKVDTNSLSSGLYYIEVITNKGKSTQKLVIE